jgi:hypothetical protein
VRLETEKALLFFAKKEAKKLSFIEGCGTIQANARKEQKFFGSFFQKRTFSFLPLI